MTRLTPALGLTLLLGHTHFALGAPPTVMGNATSAECVDATVLAASMFASTSKRLYAPLLIPQNMRSTLILGASKLDISGGDALQATDAFERLPQQTMRSVYWAREVDAGKRIVVAETPVGWRGDMYSLYLLDEAIEQSSFLSTLQSSHQDARSAPLISDAWRPPLVFQLPDGNRKWFIDVAQPYEVLANWDVHSAGTVEPVCRIMFRNAEENPDKPLPAAVRTLAARLNETLGPGHDEGTLQPTARQRLHAQHVLANAAYRPWALSDDDAYNSRSEVDAGLEDWARATRARRRLRGDILKIYPKAEHSLSAYYTHTFNLPTQKANEVSAWVLDLVLRSFFTFPNGSDYFRYDGIRTNPWPRDIDAAGDRSTDVQQQVPADVPASGPSALREGRG